MLTTTWRQVISTSPLRLEGVSIKNIFNTALVTLGTILFIACGADSSQPKTPANASSCQTPLQMSDNAMVTYSFTYSDGEEVDHTIQKIADGNASGEAAYTVSNGRSFNFTLGNLCGNTSPLSLTTEESFLLLGASLVPSTSPDDNQDSSPPLDFSLQTCVQESLIVEAGEFEVSRCQYSAANSNITFSQSSHESLGQATPLSGLVRYELNNTSRDIVVELKEWNGL